MATARKRPAPAPKSPKAGAKTVLRGLAGGAAPLGEEWSCGHRPLPLYVQRGEGGSFRPEFVAWLCPGGVLAASPAHPDELEEALLGLLRQALANPLAGKPRRPASVRVGDARLAPAVAKALGPDVRVQVGPTPEVDALAAHFVEHLDRDSPAPERDPWVGDGLDPDEVRGFFAAAAALYRAAPWKVVPGDATLFAVDAPALGLKDACLSIIGGAGIDFGFLLFDSVADYEAMRQMGTSIGEGDSPKGPGVSLFSVSFEPAAEMPKATRAAVSRQGWPVAGPKAYPLLLLVDPDNVSRPPTAEDLARARALCEALARLTRAHRGRLADELGPTLRETYVIEGAPGRPEVTLTLPHPDDESARLLSDEDALAEEIDDWVAAFVRAQEAKRPDAAWLDASAAVVGSLLEFKANMHRPTFGRWAPIEVEEFLVDHVPRKLSLTPETLDALPGALDAFFAWLGASGRTDAASSAALRRVVAELADESRRRALDPSNYGMAKAMVAKMLEQGYDPTSQKSVAAFTKKYNADVAAGREAMPSFRMMPLPPPARGASPLHERARSSAPEPPPRSKRKGAGEAPPEDAEIVFLDALRSAKGRPEPATTAKTGLKRAAAKAKPAGPAAAKAKAGPAAAKAKAAKAQAATKAGPAAAKAQAKAAKAQAPKQGAAAKAKAAGATTANKGATKKGATTAAKKGAAKSPAAKKVTKGR